MSRWLALAEGTEGNTETLPDNPTIPDKTPGKHPQAAELRPQVAFCRVMSGCQVGIKEKPADSEFSLRRENPDTDAFQERAAICEFDGGLSRADAEELAAECQGYSNVVAFRAAQRRGITNE